MQEGVDILAVLEAAMDRNTHHYKQDFEADREIIQKAAASPEPERRLLLWLSRPCGTECFYERDAYIRERYAHHAWTYHAGTSGPFAAYAIEITGLRDGKPVGSLCPLDYRRHAAQVNLRALPAQAVSLAFSDGDAACCGYAEYRKNIHALAALHGAVTQMTLHPEDERALDAVLREARAERKGRTKKRRNLHEREPDY